jgi:hypothetical protein
LGQWAENENKSTNNFSANFEEESQKNIVALVEKKKVEKRSDSKRLGTGTHYS